jgi:predicted RNA polymerase sigma factor
VRKDAHTEGMLRELAPQILGVLVRRYGQFDACEDAVQEALLAAALQWPDQGLPENPRGWLITVASRRMTDQVRSEAARRRREETLDAGELLSGHHRLDAVRAHLLEMAGDRAAARSSYRTAARRTISFPEQRYLEARAVRLAENEQNSAPSA